MPRILASGGTTLPATASKKNIKSTFACLGCQTPLLHSDIYKVEEKKTTQHFQIEIMGIDSQTNMIQNELYECRKAIRN